MAWALFGEVEVEFFASTEHLTTLRSRLAAGRSSANEQHPGEEFLFVLAGDLVVSTPTAEAANCLYLGPGDSAVIPPDVPHAYLASGDGAGGLADWNRSWAEFDS